VRLTKTADDGQINNVFFKVSKLNSDGDVISTSTWGGTNADGYIEKWIDEGTYKVQEIGYGPQGSLPSYVTLPDPITFTVDTDVVEEYDDIGYYSITMNNKATIHIRVLKSDKSNSNKYVNGAKYGIYNDKGKLLEELITDTVQVGDITYEGFAISNDTYPFGNYYLQEIEAPAGYLIDDTKYEFIVNADNLDKYQGSGPSYKYNHITIKTSDNPTSAYVTKTDITGSEELSGAKLVLKKGDEVIDTWTSSTEPHKIYGLVFGTEYTLSETISPDGYSTTESITFTYSEDGQIVQMKDDTTKYQFVKKDNKGNILSGAKLQLSDEDTKDVVAEWTTSDTPYTVSKLTVGKTYRLKELSAPSPRYKLADDITFTVKDTSEIQTITMTDEIYYGSVTIQKQDDEGNNLGGAEFELYKSDGTKLSTTKNDDGKYSVSSDGTVTSMPTDDNGKLLIDTIELGDYYLTESKAPNGKLPYTGKIEFTISSDSEVSLNQSFTVKDDNVVMLDTGGNGYSIPFIIGIVLLLLSSSIIFIYYRRKKQ
jgi:LPXTG-motif cell wall-anchored protein